MKDYSDLLLRLKYRGSDYSVTQEAIQAIKQLLKERDAAIGDIQKLQEENLAMKKVMYGKCELCTHYYEKSMDSICLKCKKNYRSWVEGTVDGFYWELVTI